MCEQQATELGTYLAALDKARAALAADPLAAREGAVLSSANAVEVTDDALITPIPTGVTVEIGKDNIYVAGERFAPSKKFSALKADTLKVQLGAGMCPDGDGVDNDLLDVIVAVHPGAPWEPVKQVVEAADNAGAARVLFAVVTPSGVVAPAAPTPPVADGADAIAACPALAKAVARPDAADAAAADGAGSRSAAILDAFKSCQCAVPHDKVRALAYRHSGLAERQGQIPAAVALALVDAEARPKARRTVVSAKKDAPWSEVHRTTFATLRAGRAFIAATDGVRPKKQRLAVPAERTRAHCQRTLARNRAMNATGILSQLKTTQGGAFARLTGTGDFKSGLGDGDADVWDALTGDEVGEMSGGFGFGRSGQEAGGGGEGWGTIGTGNYGTIGHGSGTCCGTGSPVRTGDSDKPLKRIKPPKVRIGNAVVSGPLDKNIVRRYIRRKLPRIKYCYEKKLLVKPGIQGTVDASFEITDSGAVVNATADGVDRDVADCVAGVLKTIKFPRPKGGETVSVQYPFKFMPE